MGIETVDPFRKFLSAHGLSERCRVNRCGEVSVDGSFLCQKHLDRAFKYFEGQLGLDPLHHMKHDIKLRNNMAWTYFVGSREHQVVKIGVTSQLKVRMSTLRNTSPVPIKLFAVVFGWPGIEEHLHETFRADRMHGEWFKLTDEISNCIDSIKRQDFSKYIPDDLHVSTLEERVEVMIDRISEGGEVRDPKMRTKTPVLDFLNGY